MIYGHKITQTQEPAPYLTRKKILARLPGPPKLTIAVSWNQRHVRGEPVHGNCGAYFWPAITYMKEAGVIALTMTALIVNLKISE